MEGQLHVVVSADLTNPNILHSKCSLAMSLRDRVIGLGRRRHPKRDCGRRFHVSWQYNVTLITVLAPDVDPTSRFEAHRCAAFCRSLNRIGRDSISCCTKPPRIRSMSLCIRTDGRWGPY